MKWRHLMLMIALASPLAACGITDAFDTTVERDGSHVEGVGRIEIAPLQTAVPVWGIHGADRRWYFPIDGIPEAFQERGLRVRFEGRLRSDILALMALGELIELNKLNRD